jgi:hypothetical protein
MEQRMADQGIPQGSEAYNRGADELGRQRNDARQQAILAGGQEQSRMFGMDLDRGNFTNQATAQSVNQDQASRADQVGVRQRQIQELLMQRSQPINEIGALLGTGQVGMPSFQQTTPVNVQGTDVIGAYGAKASADQAAANSRQAQSNSTGQLLGTAATAAAMFF